MATPKNTICLWFNRDAEEAAAFYAKTSPDSRITAIRHAPSDFPDGKRRVGNGGTESACGWCKDKWGVSWQITPVVLTNAMSSSDPAEAKRVFDAMMKMKKIDVAAIERARKG